MSYRGFLLPDDRIAVWSTESSYTEADPRAGVPEPSQAGSMALGAAGTQTAGTSLDVRTQQGGHPIRGGASYIWRRTGDTDAQWRGWDPPLSMSGWEAASWTDGSGAVISDLDPHAVVTDDGALLVVTRYNETGFATGTHGVRVWKRPANSSTWASYGVWGQSTSPTVAARSCLMRLPSGRIHCYSLYAAGSGSTVILYYSDDDGVTWSHGGDVLGSAISSSATPERIRAVYHRGQALLLIGTTYASGTAGRAEHYASDDMGLTFSKVATVDLTVAAYGWDAVASDAGIVVVAYQDALTRPIISFQLSDAYAALPIYSDWTEVLDVGSSQGRLSGATHLAAAATDDGALVVYAVLSGSTTPDTATRAVWSVSWDSGGSWTSDNPDYIGAKWWDSDTADYPAAIAATYYRGRMAVVGNWVASSGNEDNSLGVWWLGGWTSTPHPPLYRTTDWRTRATWSVTWSPIELPGDSGWTAGGAGTQTLTSPGHLALSCTSAQTRTYSRTPAGDIDEGLRVRLVVRPTGGGSISTTRHSIRLRLGDGTNSYAVSLRFSTSQAALYDDTAGTQIGSTMSIQNFSASGGEFCVGLSRASVRVWFRTYDRSDDDRLFVEGPTSTTVSDGGASTNNIEWGMRTTAATTDTAEWIEVHYASDADGGAQPWSTVSFPRDLPGGNYGPRSYTDAEVSLIAQDGPTWRGEQWVVAARAGYSLVRALTVPSPRAGWRSTSTAQQQIALQWDSVAASRGEAPYLGIALLRSTLTRAQVEYHDGTSWVSVGTVDLGWSGLAFTRAGSAVVASSASDLALSYAEARGWSFGLSSTVARRIVSHPEGRWSTSGLRLTLRLDDAVSGDPGSGAGWLTPDAVVLLVRVPVNARGVRLTQPIPAATIAPPPETYWEVGTIVVGWVRPDEAPDWAQDLTTEVSVELDEARDRSRRTRRAGPARRVRRLSWVSGAYDLTPHRQGRPDALGGGIAAAVGRYGIPLSLPAIVDLVSGPHRPVVYLPSLPDDPGALYVIRRRDDILYGRLSEEIRVDQVVGTEGEDDVYRVGELIITEEV